MDIIRRVKKSSENWLKIAKRDLKVASDDIDELDKTLSKERVIKILKDTRRVFSWLEKKL